MRRVSTVSKRNRVASQRAPVVATKSEEFAALRARCERNAAERDAALILLGELVAHVTRAGGYMLAGDQATLRTAKALLVEQGWDVP